MIEIILATCLLISIVGIIIVFTRKTQFSEFVESNANLMKINSQLNSEIKNLKSKLLHSENRRKNLLSINKGKKALITNYSLTYEKGQKGEIDFKVDCEVDVIEVTDRKIKVSPYKVITDSNKINSDPSLLNDIIDFFKDKWIDMSYVQPILDTQVIRQDKLEEFIDQS